MPETFRCRTEWSIKPKDRVEFLNLNFILHHITSIFYSFQATTSGQLFEITYFQSKASVYSQRKAPSVFRMDQGPSNKSPAHSEPLKLSDIRTPLGEPMDEFSVSSLAEDPIEWHKRYWHSLWFVGVGYGEDPILMAFRIEMEIKTIADAEIAEELRCFWIERRRIIEAEDQDGQSPTNRLFRFQEKIAKCGKQKHLNRDVERMLEDKGQKTRAYLLYWENWLDKTSKALNRGEALFREKRDKRPELREKLLELFYEVSERLSVLYQRLNDEEMDEREEEVRTSDTTDS